MTRRLGALLAALLLLGAGTAAAQVSDINQSKQKLEEIRRERERLEAQQRRIQGQVSETDAQLRNLQQRQVATSRMVNIIEGQIAGLGSQLDRSAAELALAQDNLAERKAVLNRRLADIYKRGPLHTFQVLLTAESFGDLLARYKYLYLTSRQDKALVEDVKSLTTRVQGQRSDILGLKTELDRKRLDREAEMEHFADLADEQSTKLSQLRKTSQQTVTRITAARREEAAITDLLAGLERNRKSAAAKPGAAPAVGRLTTADIGKLDWPVDGEVLYQFGSDSLPNGGVVLHNGIGIGAPVGTPVRVIGAGTVAMVQAIGSYGQSVIVQHGDTHYSLYMQLQRAVVRVGQTLEKGEVLGTVGGANSDLGPHLYFEIRGQNAIALDPANWLRSRKN